MKFQATYTTSARQEGDTYLVVDSVTGGVRWVPKDVFEAQHAPVETYQQRMKLELSELETRIATLQGALIMRGSPISAEQRELMRQQLDAMRTYRDILLKRLETSEAIPFGIYALPRNFRIKERSAEKLIPMSNATDADVKALWDRSLATIREAPVRGAAWTPQQRREHARYLKYDGLGVRLWYNDAWRPVGPAWVWAPKACFKTSSPIRRPKDLQWWATECGKLFKSKEAAHEAGYS